MPVRAESSALRVVHKMECSTLALATSTLATLQYVELEQVKSELEGAERALAKLTADSNDHVARATEVPPPAQPPPMQHLESGGRELPDFTLNSAKLHAAWELLKHCDELVEPTCEHALAEFKRHLPEGRFLQCETSQLDASRLCWISLE